MLLFGTAAWATGQHAMVGWAGCSICKHLSVVEGGLGGAPANAIPEGMLLLCSMTSCAGGQVYHVEEGPVGSQRSTV